LYGYNQKIRGSFSDDSISLEILSNTPNNREKKEAFIKAKYITKTYKSKEENRTVEDSALQYSNIFLSQLALRASVLMILSEMSRYAAVEFKQDYEAFLSYTLRQLSLSPRFISNIVCDLLALPPRNNLMF